MNTPIISSYHLKTLKVLVATFEQHSIEYQFTGGLAGNIYGSTWPLQDIDIDVAQIDIPRVIHSFKDYIIRPFSKFIDEEFELMLLTLKMNDVVVEINQSENSFIFTKGRRQKLDIDLSKRQKKVFLELEMYVPPLSDLIYYKQLLNRQADVRDLIQLAGH
ncbi:MAG TPA: hypothetical protein V6C95_22445 [Coleofasciculaceae cyanobacterium]